MDPILVWAVDAFEPPGDLLNSAIRAVESLAPRLGASVEPVYLLTPSQINLATEFSEIAEAPQTSSYKPAAERAIRELLKNCAIPNLLPPRVLVVDNTSTRAAIDALSRYADGIGARGIVVSSHGRTGLGRFLLGSFAETLTVHSRCPVVIVHPGAEVARGENFKRMLVPTDLSEVGREYWNDSMAIAGELGLEILLFHCVPYPVEPVIQSGVYLLSGGWLPIHEYMSDEIQRRQKRLDEWITIGKSQGLKISGVVQAEGGGIADAILRHAKTEHTNLIAMAVQSGPILSAVLGSVTREVSRRARCPVWILRHSSLKKAKKEAA